MKKFLSVFVVTLLIVSCTGTLKDKKVEEDTTSTSPSLELVTHKFKIDGLQDSTISDTIWRMIFHVGGIYENIISVEDSMVIFKVDPDSVDMQTLRDEIIKRGGVVLD